MALYRCGGSHPKIFCNLQGGQTAERKPIVLNSIINDSNYVNSSGSNITFNQSLEVNFRVYFFARTASGRASGHGRYVRMTVNGTTYTLGKDGSITPNVGTPGSTSTYWWNSMVTKTYTYEFNQGDVVSFVCEDYQSESGYGSTGMLDIIIYRNS